MKTYLLTLVLISPILLFAQTSSTIDIIGGIDYSFRILHYSGNDLTSQAALNTREGEKGKINFRIGANYNLKLTERFWLKTGMRLASIGYKGRKKEGLRWGSEYDPVTGTWTPDPSLPHEIQFIYNFWFIELPINGRLEFGTGKWIPFVEAGISPNVYLRTKTKQITEFGKSVNFDRTTGINTLNLSTNISFGLNYLMNEKMILFFQPTFRYHLSSLSDSPIKEHLYNFGLESGLRFRI